MSNSIVNDQYLKDIGTWDAYSAQSVSSKLKERVSVKDFGAVGDGITNDTIAFQTAIDSGTNVYIPNGTYKIQSTLYVRVGLNLIGQSMEDTIIDGSSMTTPIFSEQLDRYGAGYRKQGTRHCKFQSFKLVGNQSSSSNHLFASYYGFHRNLFEQVWFFSTGGNALHIDADTYGYGGYYNTIRNCTFGDCTDFSSGSDTSVIKGNGIYCIGSCNMNTVQSNNFWRIKGNAIHLVGTVTWSIQKWSILDNGIEGSGFYNTTPTSFDNGFYGVRIEGNALSMNIERNYIEANGITATGFYGGGVYTNNTALDITILDNLTSSNPYAFYIKNANSVNIDRNAHVQQSTYYDIYIYALNKGFANIGQNASFSQISGKYLNVALPTQPKVYGDARNALQRGNTVLYSKFTPKLYGGSTEISCSTAVATHEVISNGRVKFDFNFVVSNLNGATGLIGCTGSDGINLPAPGLGATIQFPSRSDGNLVPASAPVFHSLVALDTGRTDVRAIWNQTGANYCFLRQYGPGSLINDINLNATSLTVGSSLSFSIIIEV